MSNTPVLGRFAHRPPWWHSGGSLIASTRGGLAGMFTFRRLTRSDFDLLARWLAEPHVAEWWDHEYTSDALDRDFGPTADGDEPAEDYVALLDGEPVGIVQYCHFVDYPDYVEEMDDVYSVGEGAVTIDYLIGDRERVGRGVAAAMIDAFVARIWSADPKATHIVVPVNSLNERSWRALLRAGFHLVARGDLEPDSPRHEPLHEILRLDRPGDTAAIPPS
jgi:aminoglycoside 6'-N-acetyltransferase